MSAGENLRAEKAAMRLSFTWWGVRKTLTVDQKEEAAETFSAEGEFLSAGKKLIDTKDTHYRACTQIRSQAGAYWKSLSLPFPEPGVRLINREDIEAITSRLVAFSGALRSALVELDIHFDGLKESARERLGRLYNPSDYPYSMQGAFSIGWEFPSVEAPDYLRALNPSLYAAECQRVARRFDEALALAEQAFLEEIAGMVSHLTERLSGTDDGKPKVFRASAVENIREFFERFRHLNVRSNHELDALVERAAAIVDGVEPQLLRDHSGLRQEVATQLSVVQAGLEGMLVERPRRSIQRPARTQSNI